MLVLRRLTRGSFNPGHSNSSLNCWGSTRCVLRLNVSVRVVGCVRPTGFYSGLAHR